MPVGPSAAEQTNASGRQKLAIWVVVGSFLTLFLLVGTMLAIAELDDAHNKASDLAEKTFNAILPVLASWVGTVLAFYFSAQSQERTSASLDKSIDSKSAVYGKTAAEVMTPLGQIRRLIDLDTIGPEALTPENLRLIFKTEDPEKTEESARSGQTGASGTTQKDKPKFPDKIINVGKTSVSRLIFVNTNVFRYVVHESTLNAFLVDPQDAAGGKLDPAKATFEQFRSDSKVLNQISRLVVFVAAGTSLQDAKAALDRVAGAQDIIVTATGNSSDPMLGWISNVDLIKALDGH